MTPCRLIRTLKNSGLIDLEQIEPAPEYDPDVTLTAEVVRAYVRGER